MASKGKSKEQRRISQMGTLGKSKWGKNLMNRLAGEEQMGQEFHEWTRWGKSGYKLSVVAGSVTVKVDPRPISLTAWIEPPCRSTIFAQMARPIPVPS
jgi:hypothetical protein